MKMCRSFAMLLGSLALSLPALALESYVTYDGFTAAPLSAARWRDFERTRQVSAEALMLVQRDWGDTASDVGRIGVSFGDNLSSSGPVTQLRAAVRVSSIDMTGCAANATPTRVRARLLGTFFNSGNRVSGSFVGDVLAQVYLYRDSNSADAANVLRVEGSVVMCTSVDCNQGIGIGAPVSLGTATVGQGVVLQIEWDKVGKRFVFARDNGGTSGSVTYTQNDSYDPGSPFKGVGNRTDVASCASGPRAFGYVDARYDSVSVNSRARP